MLRGGCFHTAPHREGGVAAVTGSGAHAGSAGCRTVPIRLYGSLLIHADGSILLQEHLHWFLRRRRHDIHHLEKGAGIPHVGIGGPQTIPIPPPIEEQVGIAGKPDCRQELTGENELGQRQFEYHPDKLVCQTL